LSVSRSAPVSKGPSGAVEGVVLAAAVAVGGLLDPASALVRGVAGQADDVERVHDCDRVGELLGGGGPEAGEPVRRDDLDAVAPGLRALAQPGLEGLLGAALDHVEQPCWSGAVTGAGEVDDHGDVFVAAPGAPPHVLVHAGRGDAVESGRIVDQDALALGQHGVVRGVPRNPETLGDPGHRQVLAHDGFQRPPQPTPRRLRSRLGRLRGVLASHVSAPGAAVATHGDQRRRRAPAQRLVGEFSGHRVARHAFAATTSAPLIGFEDPARQHGAIWVEALAGDFKAEPVESAERGQVGASEGSVRQVEVFQTASVRTSIIGRPRRLPRHRPRTGRYTTICEEPLKRAEALLGRKETGGDPAWIRYFDAEEMAGESAHCFRDLQDGRSAQEFARLAVVPQATPPRTRAFIGMVDADAARQSRQLDEACALASESVRTAGPLKSARYQTYLRDFSAALQAEYPGSTYTAEFRRNVQVVYPWMQ
jgi:hypothetical protein